MKKILIIFILFFCFINTSFSYNITEKDTKILDKVYIKLDKLNYEKLEKINFKIINYLRKNKKDSRNKFLLIEIKKYISNSLSKKNNYFKVIKVIDWDTIIIDYFWKRENIRFIWIDAPENSKLRKGFVECYWKESKDYLYKLLNNKKVRLEFDITQWKKDKYGRILSYVFIDWMNINNLLIKDGFALEYTYNKKYKYQKIFKKSEIEAKNKKIWIWNKNYCIEKWFKKIEENYKKNIDDSLRKCNIKWNISYKTKKKLYHLPSCTWYKKTKINLNKWEKWFCSEKEAITSWWIKAWNCK